MSPADHLELTDLVNRYAAGVDDRDLEAVAALFCADATLTSPSGTRTGREEVLAALGAVRDLPVTLHALVGAVFTAVSADEATGRIACIAHHVFERDGAARDDVWHLVYRDAYRRTPDGWRFASRELDVRFRTAGQVRLS
jgi:ketosteroid isomerase-like protein